MSKTRDILLNPYVFVKMQKLRFLNFYSSSYGENKVYAFQGLESFFNELRYLQWYGCPLKSLQLNPENLIVLDMPYSNVKQLWNGVQQLVNLKEMNLGWSRHLTSCPDLSEAPNLEELNLVGCTSLVEITPSVQSLKKIEYLDLRNCKSLTGLPDLSGMKSLESLHLTGCSSLKSLPEMPCNIELLNLDETAIEELPSAIEHLSRLVVLNLNRCSRLRSLPNSICKFKSLQRLGLSGCSKLDKLPDDIGALEALRDLEVEGTAMREVPPSIISLNNLYMLSFRRCKAHDTKGLLLPPFLGLHSLRELDLTDCGIIKLPESLGCLLSVEKLHLAINDFESLPASIINLSNLRYLDLSYCKRLQYLPELPLVTTNAYNCTSLQVLSCLSNPDTVVTKDYLAIQLDFTNCFKLDQDVLRDSVKDALLKIQCMATLWKEKYIDKDLDARPLKTIICFPGSEVPELFSFQCMESVITVELPTDWFNDNFVGFALCAIVEFQDHKIDVQDLKIFCKCKLKSGDEYEDVCAGTLDVFADLRHGTRYIESDDLVYMGFDNRMYPRHVGDNNEASFQFYIGPHNNGKRREDCKLKKCGVRLMYAQDHGEFNGSFSSVKEEDETHPQPKRLKLMEFH